MTELTKKNNKHNECNDKNLDKLGLFKFKSLPAVASLITPKEQVDTKIPEQIDDETNLRIDPEDPLVDF